MIDRRGFLKTSATAGAAALIGTKLTLAAAPDVNLEEATVAGLQTAMASGQTTARKIAEGYLERIADIDKKLNSIIELNPDALAIADRCDAENHITALRKQAVKLAANEIKRPAFEVLKVSALPDYLKKML